MMFSLHCKVFVTEYIVPSCDQLMNWAGKTGKSVLTRNNMHPRSKPGEGTTVWSLYMMIKI
jgi:hypothetical protein